MTGRETVYATRAGRAFHEKPTCRALLGGQLMNDSFKVFWLARNTSRILHRVESLRIVTAFGLGKGPCALCFPELRAAVFRGNCEDDFGHEPFEYDGVPICARCFIEHRSYREAVFWPCASAVVLGLVPRPAAVPAP